MKRCFLSLCVIIVIVSIQSKQAIGSSNTAAFVTYQEPLAYIGWDGNIWVTDIHSGAGTRITNDGETFYNEEVYLNVTADRALKPFSYSNIRWSPIESVFNTTVHNYGFDNRYEATFVAIFESGKAPFVVNDVSSKTWSVDGSSFIFIESSNCFHIDDNKASVVQHSIKTNQVTTLYRSDCGLAMIGDGPGLLRHEWLLYDERDVSPFSEPNFFLSTVTSGYLLIRGQPNQGRVELISPDGKLMWSRQLSNIGLSPNGQAAYAVEHRNDHEQPVLIDFATGKETEVTTLTMSH